MSDFRLLIIVLLTLIGIILGQQVGSWLAWREYDREFYPEEKEYKTTYTTCVGKGCPGPPGQSGINP